MEEQVVDNGGTQEETQVSAPDNSAVDTNTTNVDTVNEQTTVESTLSIPEDFKNRSWTSKILNSEGKIDNDKLFKLIDGQNSLIGKKTGEVLDFNNMDEKAYEEYANKITPDEYDRKEEWSDELYNEYKDIFKYAGLNKIAANRLVEKFRERETAEREKLFGDDTYNNSMNELFKTDSERTKAEESLRGFITQYGSDKLESYLQQYMPSEALAEFTKALSKHLSDYGTTDFSKASKPSNNANLESSDAIYARLKANNYNSKAERSADIEKHQMAILAESNK